MAPAPSTSRTCWRPGEQNGSSTDDAGAATAPSRRCGPGKQATRTYGGCKQGRKTPVTRRRCAAYLFSSSQTRQSETAYARQTLMPHTRTHCHVPQEVSPQGVEAALEAGKRSCAAGHVPLRHCRWRRSCRFPPRALARRPNVIRVSCCWIRELAPAGRQAPRLHHPGWQLLSIACACVHGASLTSIVGER